MAAHFFAGDDMGRSPRGGRSTAGVFDLSEFGTSDGSARDYSLGWRLNSAVPNDPGFEVNLDATRRERANDPGSGSGAGRAEHGVMLRSLIRW